MTKPTSPAVPWFAAYLALWAGAVGYLAATRGDWGFPVFALLVFGGGGSALVLLLTRDRVVEPVAVARPWREFAAVLAYLLLYALVFLGPVMAWAQLALPPGRGHELLVFGIKLIAHVGLPLALLAALRAPIRPLFVSGVAPAVFGRVLCVLGGALVALLALVSPSLAQVAATGAGPATLAWAIPLNFIAIALVAGLNEEFLFRAVLQTRLAAVLKTGAGAVPVAALLFALAHWPGLFLRGGPGVDGWSPDPIAVAAFTIATLSPLGLMLGTAWWRTRSLPLVICLHASIDFLPSLADFIRTWG